MQSFTNKTFTAVDACGNSATTSRTVTWTSDLVPPSITANGSATTLGCNPQASDINNALGSATATDACGNTTVTQSDGAVTTSGCSLTQIRTFTAIDACGNSATTSRTVTWTSDLVPPTITANGSATTLGCNPQASDINNALGSATATDACGNTTVTQSDGAVTTSGCSLTQIRTFTAIDACGNSATTSRTVTWTSDLVPPTITANGSATTLGCNPQASDINNALGSATATDACGNTTVTQSDGAVTTSGCSLTQIRTFTAIDACGNSATTSRTVTWTSDLVPPTITANGSATTLGCNPQASDINNALGSATATDACGNTTVTQSDGAVTTSGCSLTQIRTFTAVDGCGNSATTSRTVTWTSDLVPPTITANGSATTLGCNPQASDINNALGSA